MSFSLDTPSAASLKAEARLLREERQKSAATKDRKRSEKSKKHDRWLRERETERTRRATLW